MAFKLFTLSHIKHFSIFCTLCSSTGNFRFQLLSWVRSYWKTFSERCWELWQFFHRISGAINPLGMQTNSPQKRVQLKHINAFIALCESIFQSRRGSSALQLIRSLRGLRRIVCVALVDSRGGARICHVDFAEETEREFCNYLLRSDERGEVALTWKRSGNLIAASVRKFEWGKLTSS